ncbi:Smr domain-containing protein [Fusarium oxysporum f. sp. albedinis]|nr:Smr domain-containing protein [Fusarium oxysporum f. sp. albedinis]
MSQIVWLSLGLYSVMDSLNRKATEWTIFLKSLPLPWTQIRTPSVLDQHVEAQVEGRRLRSTSSRPPALVAASQPDCKGQCFAAQSQFASAISNSAFNTALGNMAYASDHTHFVHTLDRWSLPHL